MFVPSTGRILDTFKGTGGFSTPMEAGKYRTIKVAGLAGLPDDGSVGAVSLNVTVGSAPGNGTLFGRPDTDSNRTTMVIYNGNPGEYTSNSATVAVGADGTIQVMTETSARLILDVQGYYTANSDGTAAGGFVPVAKRIVDTRSGTGAAKAAIAPGKSIDVQITGANGIPAGASGVVVNLIAANATDADGYLTPYATGGTKPANSLHYAPSANTSIQAQVPLSAAGKITIANSSTTTNLLVDLQGYFTAAGKGGAVFTPAYGRAYDSRASGNTVLGEQETRSIQIAGAAGVPVMGSGITAVVLTLIVAHGGGDGYADVWADGTSKPNTTAINFNTNEIQTNTITVPLGANGKISLRNAAKATNYVVDVQGWYSNPAAPKINCPTPAGTWLLSRPAEGVTCTAQFPPASASGITGSITLDGNFYEDVALSASAPVERAISMPLGGNHHLSAAFETSGAVHSTEFAFGFGDWTTATLSPVPAAGSVVRPDFILGVSAENDGIPDAAVAEYTIATDSAFTNIVWSSPAASGAVEVPIDAVVDKTKYWWRAIIRAPRGNSGPQIERSVFGEITVDSESETDNGETADWFDDTTDAAPIDDPNSPENSNIYISPNDATEGPSTSTSRAASAGTYITPAAWRPCGYKDKDKLVSEYTRVKATSGSHKMSGSVADLRCGDSTYGYVHILEGKMPAWNGLTFGTVSNWRDIAHWATTWVLQDPDHKVFVPKNPAKKYKTDRWCYDRDVFLKDKRTGKTVKTKKIKVIMGETGVRIITSYPTDKRCDSKSAS
ncbi:hypothetical protein DEI95_05425 [Curtobacterium sp. MCBD17_008]|nr:hypothetical protein DEI95_05425 [Curtobacterium sp. MCBD17_008]